MRVRPIADPATRAALPLVAATSAALLALLATSVAARAECRAPVERFSLKDFTHRPSRYMDHFPSGGDGLVKNVRNFAAFNREGLQAVKAAIRTANLSQKQAIGTGMALAVTACLPRDGEIARQIADVVKASDDPDVTDAYLAASDGAPDAPAPASKPADDAPPKGVRPGEALDIPSTAVPKLVPEIKKIP